MTETKRARRNASECCDAINLYMQIVKAMVRDCEIRSSFLLSSVVSWPGCQENWFNNLKTGGMEMRWRRKIMASYCSSLFPCDAHVMTTTHSPAFGMFVNIFSGFIYYSVSICAPSIQTVKTKGGNLKRIFHLFPLCPLGFSFEVESFFSPFRCGNRHRRNNKLVEISNWMKFLWNEELTWTWNFFFLRGSKFKYDFGWNVFNSIPVFALLSPPPLAMLPCFITITTI